MTDILMVPEKQERVMPTKFRGALVYITSNKSIPSSTGTMVEWDEYKYDTDGFWNPNEPTKLIIPRGVKRVRLTANVRWHASSEDANSRWAWIRGNESDDAFSGMGQSRQIATPKTDVIQNVQSAVVEVQEGDYFQFRLYHDENGARSIRSQGGFTWFSIEVID